MSPRSLTLSTSIGANAFQYAGRDALVDDTSRITHRELERRTNRLARSMLARGIGKGDRIALLLPDGIQFVELMIAAGKVGATSILLNWRLSKDEIAWIVDNGMPKAIYFAERFSPLVPAREDLATHLICDEPLAALQYEAWASEGPDDAVDAELEGTHPLFMMFTSGTTGRPKGCVHSHEGTVLHALAYAARRGFTRDDRSLTVNPLFHVGGLGHLLAVLVVGGANCFYSRDAGPTAPVDVAIRERCTLATLGKPLIDAWKLAGHVPASEIRFRSLSWGAGIVDPLSVEWVRSEWNALVVGGWGQTEVGGFNTFIDYPDMLEHPTSMGWPLQHVSMAVLDARGLPLSDPDGEGELGVRGPSVMTGYWNNPSATEEAMSTGWLRTGDLVRRDERGLFYMSGRSKELIKSGGENVYPVEVEVVLKQLPGVADAAVAGVKDATWGEAIKAFVVLEPGAVFNADLMTLACRSRIAGYKRPRYLEIVDAIPRDYLGKIRRYELSARPVRPEQAVD